MLKEEPILSVFVFRTPGREVEWFEKCLASLVHPKVQVLLVDGCVGAAALHRFRFDCATQCQTPYLCFVDDDDWIDNTHLSPMLKVLEANPNAGGLFTDEHITDASGTRKKIRAAQRPELSATSGHHHPMDLHHLVIVSAELARQVSSELTDLEKMSCEVLLYGSVAQRAPLVYYPHPVYYWRRHTSSVLHTENKTVQGCFTRAKEILKQRYLDQEIK